jgi:hypothetical protein
MDVVINRFGIVLYTATFRAMGKVLGLQRLFKFNQNLAKISFLVKLEQFTVLPKQQYFIYASKISCATSTVCICAFDFFLVDIFFCVMVKKLG